VEIGRFQVPQFTVSMKGLASFRVETARIYQIPSRKTHDIQKLATFSPSTYTCQIMILLVEDEAISRYAFAQMLRSHGHEVMEAKDGIEALALLDKYPFDLVITDLVMPGLDGFGLVFRIREKWPAMPLVLISGYSTEYARAAMVESTEFLAKPIDPPILIRTVQRLLGQVQRAE
jgi:CheY-like chemotaxis protein